MDNKELIMYLNEQVDDKSREIGENNYRNVKLRMDRQHLENAIKKLREKK